MHHLDREERTFYWSGQPCRLDGLSVIVSSSPVHVLRLLVQCCRLSFEHGTSAPRPFFEYCKLMLFVLEDFQVNILHEKRGVAMVSFHFHPIPLFSNRQRLQRKWRYQRCDSVRIRFAPVKSAHAQLLRASFPHRGGCTCSLCVMTRVRPSCGRSRPSLRCGRTR